MTDLTAMRGSRPPRPAPAQHHRAKYRQATSPAATARPAICSVPHSHRLLTITRADAPLFLGCWRWEVRRGRRGRQADIRTSWPAAEAAPEWPLATKPGLHRAGSYSGRAGGLRGVYLSAAPPGAASAA